MGASGDCLSQGALMFRAGVDPRAVSDAMIASGDGTGAVDVAAVAARVIGAAVTPGGVAPASDALSPWLQSKRSRSKPGAGIVRGPPPRDPPPPPTAEPPCRDPPPPPTPGASPP